MNDMTNLTTFITGGALSALGVIGEAMSPEGGLFSVFAATGAGGALAWVLIRNQLRKNDQRDDRLAKVEDDRRDLVREVINATNACTGAVREIASSVERSSKLQEDTCFHVRSLVETMRERPFLVEKGKNHHE